MKKLLLVITAVFCHLLTTGQTKHSYKYISAGIQPQYAIRFGNSNTVKFPSDSALTTHEKNRAGFTAFVHFEKELGKNTRLQAGLQYTNVGFIKVVSNLKYTTRIHPDVQVLDQTILTAPEPTAELNYVFDYLDATAILNRKLFVSNAKLKRWEFFVSYGASLNFLLQDRVAVRLKGFTMNNDRSFNLKNTYLKSNFFNITGHLGLRANYEYSNKLGFITQPLFNAYLLNATTGAQKYHFVSLGLQVGFYYNLDVKGEEIVTE